MQPHLRFSGLSSPHRRGRQLVSHFPHIYFPLFFPVNVPHTPLKESSSQRWSIFATNLLENLHTPLVKACMRQWFHNRTFWKDPLCARACERVVPTNQCLWLDHTSLVGFLRRASPGGSATLPPRCTWLSTFPCWSQ